MAYFDIIILAALALFVGHRLWSILGTHEKPIRRTRPGDDDNIVPIRATKKQKQIHDKPTTIQPSDPSAFNEDHFLQGADVAFKTIVTAYGAHDKKVLKSLMETSVYKAFTQAIDAREKDNTFLEIDFSQIVSSEVTHKRIEKAKAYVTVKFISEQCVVTRAEDGKVIAGDPEHFSEITDIWTFMRHLDSQDPNWKLASTEAVEKDDSKNNS